MDWLICCRHFLTADMEKFHELWVMNEERCKEMAQKLLDADRIVFEQQLGLTWTPNDLEFMNNVGPIDAKKIPKPSIDVVREILTDQAVVVDERGEEEGDESGVSQTTSQLSHASMKAILEILCDEGVSQSIDRILCRRISFLVKGISRRTETIGVIRTVRNQ